MTNVDIYDIMIVSNERKVDMKNLGTMNGWKEQPKEYTKHLAECGTEYQATIIYNEPNPNGVGLVRKERQETRRKYDTVVTKVGTYSVKRTETCNECGCSWNSYS